MTNAFTALFLAALVLTTVLRLWLAQRHVRHIAAHRDAVPDAFREIIALQAHRRAADYTTARVRLAMVEVVAGAGLVLALTLGGLLQAMHAGWAALGLDNLPLGLAFIAGLAVLNAVIDLPFSLWRTFVIEERFGFNKMTPRLFAIDAAKGALLGAVIGLPLLAAVLWLMERMGDCWWLYVWLFWLGFNLLALLIYPTVIAPLFNKFTPLADESLRSRIEALLARCGFRSSGLFVMDGSKRSSHGNAYFTGFGAARRIVFFDTLLEKLAPAEIEAVLAHELGHYKRRHVWKRIGLLALASLAFLWLLGALIDAPWFYAGLGMQAQGAAPALVLFSLVIPLFAFPLSPLMSALSRRHEYEADTYAARQTRTADLVAALVKLYRDNAATLTPDPLYSTFYDSHPPAAARIAHLQGT
ncbi:MAG: peptidase [Rhodocyclaceae bacterium]|jgi:STE24 endopeptidase|uniref:Peptidase M48 n=1 Tax=Candidatus Desulfobacillus denitrificans TaxID=2608985 RepID=A0A809S9M0_9PROT|nr:M48 family metallopeptidase [Rhodocyclaceae bacterium]OQY70237.1 MAG: peptidase M48 [Rhodocyclaceae bacterium UTPRO2]BBO20334.1 peptidase M48 [Candidatus Desulfobacillus denitrificans]GIK44594.1 MAG: peptidase [Betaproteobacteria bacterium]MCL4725040.1 M48 family metallopeptidase [Rhodocyclaceae bacterium]